MNTFFSNSATILGKWLTTVALACSASAVLATPFPNLDPLTLGDDIEGTGYFTFADDGLFSFSIELYDLFDTVSEFGIIDRDDPATLIPIFEEADLSTSEGGIAVAVIDLLAGFVLDGEDPDVDQPQNTFTPVAEAIGFYLAIQGFPVLYSDPTLNPVGADFMGAFPSLTEDIISLNFWSGPADAVGQASQILSVHAFSNLDPADEIPVPSSLALILLGLLALTRRQTR